MHNKRRRLDLVAGRKEVGRVMVAERRLQTVQKWFEWEANEWVRRKLLRSLEPQSAMLTVYSLADAVGIGFLWERTREGWDYWYRVHEGFLMQEKGGVA